MSFDSASTATETTSHFLTRGGPSCLAVPCLAMIMRMGLVASAFKLTREERRFAAAAWLLAPVVTLLLRRFGFRKTVEIVREWVTPSPASGAKPVPIERAEALVARAFGLTVAHDSCLPRSIVQLAIHRRNGDAVKLVIGVRRDGRFGDADIDFEGHAWVEAVDGPSRDERHTVIHEVSSA